MINIYIRIVDFSDSCTHKMLLANKKEFKECNIEKKHPSIVLVYGKGVITRSIAEDKTIKERILNNNSLYWSEDKNRETISFIRKTQIDCELKNISSVLEIIIVEKVDDDLIKDVINNFYTNTLTINNLIKYKNDCKKIFPFLIKKIEIPYAVMLFVVLLANFFINTNLSEKNSKVQMELLASRRLVENFKNKQINESKFLLENQSNRSIEATVMIDSICTKLPIGIKLNSFTIDPLKGRLDTNRPMKLDSGCITIIGVTASANDIPVFVSRIDGLNFSKEVKIKNITQEKNGKNLEFEIEIRYDKTL